MPTVNIRIQGNRRDNKGNVVPLFPAVALQEIGPIVQVVLSPLPEHVKNMVEKGQQPPKPFAGIALIDTGASVTCIDRTAAEASGLTVTDSGPVNSATHANEVVPIYAGKIEIQGLPPCNIPRAYGVNLGAQKICVLIGRDMLASCVLVYNGAEGFVSLSY